MSFFSRNKDKNAIPPVAGESYGNSSSPRPARSAGNTYVPSRDMNLFSSNPPVNRAPLYKPMDDPYSTGSSSFRSNNDNPENARNELFSGYNPEKANSGRFYDGPTMSREPPPPGEETEEDVEAIKQQTRFVKQESVNSTRNALRMAREAEETARNTLTRLGDQSEKLANTERHLDVSKGHSQRADDKTDELKKLNRSIFRPAITFNKDSKRRAQEAKIQARYDEEREEREKAMMDIRESQNRLGRAATYGREGEEDGMGRIRGQRTDAQKEQRKRFQHEADEADDQMEDELDDNLDEIHDMTKRLKALGTAMGQELDNQNSRIERIDGKTVGLDNRIFRNTERLKKIK